MAVGFEQVKEQLDDLGISYQVVDHPPALSTEQADRFIEGIDGVRTKSMFLTNKKKTAFYLVIMDDQKRLDMERFCELVDEKRVKMASPASLEEQLQLPAGVVSVFGLLNNEKKNVHVYFDREMLTEERMSFHPNVNTKTIFLTTKAVLSFVQSIGYDYQVVDL